MRILVFHGDLSRPSGGEVNARDWALGLKARGHKVSMYGLRLGPLAEQIRHRGIPVVDDPAAITDAPDVIMGTGVNELATLIARFPRSAGIQVAQLWNHWVSCPCPLPQVVLHIAVDDINFEMLANEFGVPRERIRLVHNAVDLPRIAPRTEPLPSRPRRMLVFAKNQSDYADPVREACARRNIDVDFMGNWIGRPIDDPLRIIRDYDIVVGSARTALEGAACGAAVLVADGRGLAAMLTTTNFDHFRKHNFGREVLIRPLTAEAIGKEIDAYDAEDALQVSRLVLQNAGLDRQLEEIEMIFKEAVDLLAQARLTDAEIQRALSSYLARHLPRAVEGEPSPRHKPSDASHLHETRLAAVERKLSDTAEQLVSQAETLYETIREVARRETDTVRRDAEAARRDAEADRRLAPLFDLAASIERNRSALDLLTPVARLMRWLTRTRTPR
jgi:hypothetical protein